MVKEWWSWKLQMDIDSVILRSVIHGVCEVLRIGFTWIWITAPSLSEASIMPVAPG